MCLLLLFFTLHGNDSQWSMTIWTINSQSCFNSVTDMQFGGNGPLVSKEKLFESIMILYMYTAKGQGRTIFTDLNFDCNFKAFAASIIYCIFWTLQLFCLCLCVHIALYGHFIIYLSLPKRTELLSPHLHWISKEMGEEVFQLHVAAPTYPTYPMSLYN